MDFLEKVQKVKDKLTIHQEHHGDTFDYFVDDLVYVNELEGDPNYGDERVYLARSEHLAVINYLANTLYLDILEDKGHHLEIKILPPSEPWIKSKTLELIARELKDYFTGTDIVSLLTECGVDKRLIVYPNSKWVVFYNVFNELNYHRNPKDKALLRKIICDAIHPLNLGGNQELSLDLARKFNEFLKYDELSIAFNEKEKVYKIYEELPEEIEQEMQQEEYERAENQSKFLSQPENIEKISLLRKSFQTFLNVVELFCADPSHPTTELNDAYTYLTRQINKIISDLKLDEWTLNDYHLYDYHSPFTNLFGAEKHYRDFNMELSWEAIRPKMNAAYGQIEDIYRDVNGSDILNDAESQKKLGDIQVYLTELKAKQEEERQKNKPKPIKLKPFPIKIIGDTNIVVKEAENNSKMTPLVQVKPGDVSFDDDRATISFKGKSCQLPSFKNQHFFSKAMFEQATGEPVDWSIIYEKITGIPSKEKDKDKRMVYDTYESLNKRVYEVLSIEGLFSWDNKSIKRNY